LKQVEAATERFYVGEEAMRDGIVGDERAIGRKTTREDERESARYS